jgi:uncharacterized protein YbjQ (UPF0145 family)
MGDSAVFFVFVAVILVVTFVFGTLEQAAHYKSIKKREAKYRNILIFNEKVTPPEYSGQRYKLVCGSVVMGCDYFRRFAASLKTLFGGRLTSFEAMLDRGRREAVLRMKEDARSMGATAIFNVRLETVTLSVQSQGKQGGLTCVELVAYGTAWRAADKAGKPYV